MRLYFKLNSRFTAIVLASVCLSAKAQVFTKTTLQGGESITSPSAYLYHSFSEAIVKLKTGGQLLSKMNFNLLICQMQFIDPANDTLTLSKPEDVDSILLNGSLFFYNNNYYEVLASADSSKLLVLRTATYEPIKIGALGLPNQTGSGVQSYTSIMTVNGEKKLVMDEDVSITQQTAYLITNKNKEMMKANKAGFSKVFPKRLPLMQTYLKEHKTNFNTQEDLEKLFRFCTLKD